MPHGAIKIELNREGVRYAALTSPQVRSVVGQVAERIAASARAKLNDPDLNGVEVTNAGRSRARSYVRVLGPNAELIESRDRVLGSSIDAGRI